MHRSFAVIAFPLAVIGVFTSATRASARVIHCGSISLEVPDSWRAHDGRDAEHAPLGALGEPEEHGSWEAFEAGESRGYLTSGVLRRASPIASVTAPRARRELERRLRELPCVEAVRVTEFVTLSIDGAAAYRARYTLSVGRREAIEQTLYIVGGSETSFLAFTCAASSPPDDPPRQDATTFDAVMRQARVHDRLRLAGFSREFSLTILAALAGSSLLLHFIRGILLRSRVPVPVEAQAEVDERARRAPEE